MRAAGTAPLSCQLPVELLTQVINVIFAHPARVAGNPEKIKTGYGEVLPRYQSQKLLQTRTPPCVSHTGAGRWDVDND